MKTLFNNRFERTLDALVERFKAEPGARVEAWLFEGRAARLAAEQRLATLGVSAKFRSAYKPLLHFFREELPPGASNVVVRYPVITGAPKTRFLLEAYPLAGIYPEMRFEAYGSEQPVYEVMLTREGARETYRVFAPNHQHEAVSGHSYYSPTGWLRTTSEDRRLETDLERLFDTAMRNIWAYKGRLDPPFFERLTLRARIPGADEPLGFGDEVISLAEALHEDLYFSALDLLQAKAGRPLGDRTFQPGQVVPLVTYEDGPPRLTVDSGPLPKPLDTPAAAPVLATLREAPPVAAIGAAMARLPGTAFSAESRAGHTIIGRYVHGADRPVMISGGQHANETTGVIGALRAAEMLVARKGAHFTIAALENPDGYALHQQLCADHACHMHHAARFTALGDDLEYREGDAFEAAIRAKARALSAARLHINLHGYPAHEWTRPFSGYVPRGYDLWTLPKGFFLILRHRSDGAALARALIERVTQTLAADPALMAFNAAQLSLYQRHAGGSDLTLINGFPCLVYADDRAAVPLTLITEYPDETIIGDAFITGHTAQMRATLAAYEAWQALGDQETA